MRAIFSLRAPVEALEGGHWLARTITALVDAINTPPLCVGEANIHQGVGSPESRITGTKGDLYLNTSGGSTTTLYVKESGVNTKTGWIGK